MLHTATFTNVLSMSKKPFTRTNIILLLITAFLAGVVIRIVFFKRISIDIFPGPPMSLLVKDTYDIGRILTLKVTCFVCEGEDYGNKWQEIIQAQPCQDVMFQYCFRNFTKQRRRTTKVASIVRRCDVEKCECMNVQKRTRDSWCVVENCATNMMCCEEKYLRCFKSYNSWFYTGFLKT